MKIKKHDEKFQKNKHKKWRLERLLEKKKATIKINKLGVVDGAFNGKATFDEMIRTLSNRFLDYSIVDINEQNPKDIEHIREGLNKFF